MGAAVNGPARCPVCDSYKGDSGHSSRCQRCGHRWKTKGCKAASLIVRDALRDGEPLPASPCKCGKPT